jgi:hypothetical protein
MRLVRQNVRVRNWRTKREAIVSVEMEIDVDNIARELGNRAYENKSKRCTQAGGLVRVKLLGVNEVEAA